MVEKKSWAQVSSRTTSRWYYFIFSFWVLIPFLISIAYSAGDPNPWQSSVRFRRNEISILVDSSGWLIRCGFDEPNQSLRVELPNEIYTPNREMVDMIQLGLSQSGGEWLGIGYYSLRNDQDFPDADFLTARHYFVLAGSVIGTGIFLIIFGCRCRRRRKGLSV